MIFEKHQVILFSLIYLTKCVWGLSCEHNGNCKNHEIQKESVRKERALLFPPSSTIGVRDFN